MGITISVTIPKPLETALKQKAVEAGMSRSRYICNLLLKWEEKMKQPPRIKRTSASMEQSVSPAPNDCTNRDDGFCNVFDLVCNAPQTEANTCVGYPKDTNRGK
ncbi:MAG: hypothetical protein GY797_38395 [Deltaproteobacteria bacterium]|nr:hypothetical protein [Deltaproteobacteria bacterium]